MKESVLLVEDEPPVARAVARTLRLGGMDVVVAPSVARTRILDCRFTVGVLDIDLGDGSGVDLADELLERACVGQVIFFTGCGDPVVLARARRLGPVVAKRQGIGALVGVMADLVRPVSARTSVIVGPSPTLGSRRRSAG